MKRFFLVAGRDRLRRRGVRAAAELPEPADPDHHPVAAGTGDRSCRPRRRTAALDASSGSR